MGITPTASGTPGAAAERTRELGPPLPGAGPPRQGQRLGSGEAEPALLLTACFTQRPQAGLCLSGPQFPPRPDRYDSSSPAYHAAWKRQPTAKARSSGNTLTPSVQRPGSSGLHETGGVPRGWGHRQRARRPPALPAPHQVLKTCRQPNEPSRQKRGRA